LKLGDPRKGRYILRAKDSPPAQILICLYTAPHRCESLNKGPLGAKALKSRNTFSR